MDAGGLRVDAVQSLKGADVEARAPPRPARLRYRARRKARIRSGAELGSAEIGALQRGEEVIALESAQGGDNSVFIDFIRINAVVVQGQISIPNPSFEENTEVAGFNYQLPNGWQGSGGGTVVVKSPPSAPNGPWGAGSAVAQGAPDGDYFMSLRA